MSGITNVTKVSRSRSREIIQIIRVVECVMGEEKRHGGGGLNLRCLLGGHVRAGRIDHGDIDRERRRGTHRCT